MKKSELKSAKINELIVDYVQSYSMLSLNYNLNKGTKQLEKHCEDLEEELTKRNILTQEDIKKLHR